MSCQDLSPFFGRGKICHDRGQMEVDERQLISDQIAAVSRERFKRPHDAFGCEDARSDLIFIGRLSDAGSEYPVRVELPDHGPVPVRIDNRDDLRQPRPILGDGRLQRVAGKRFVNVSRNRGRLVQNEAIMNQSGDPPEWMPGKVRGRHIRREWVDFNVIVTNALLGQNQPGDP